MVKVDSRGYTWDARIHTPAKTFMADKTWKKTRGIMKDHPELVAQVEAELEAAKVGPVPTATSDSITDIPPFLQHPPVAAAEVPTVAPPVTQVAQQPVPMDYAAIAKKMSDALTVGKLTTEQCQAIIQKQGVAGFSALAELPDALMAVSAELDLIINA